MRKTGCIIARHMTEQRRHTLIGILITLLGCTLWGFSGTTVQYLISATSADAPLITMMRMCVGGSLFIICVAVSKRGALARMLSNRADIPKMVLFSFTLYANQICYSMTVQATNAGTATVFETSGAVFVMAYACIRGACLPKPRELAGLLAAIAAATMIATQGDVSTLAMPIDGLIWALLTGVSAGVYIMVPKESGLLDRYGSFSVTGMGMFIAIAFAVPAYLASGGSVQGATAAMASFAPTDWTLFILGAVIAGTMGGYGFYLKGVAMVGPVKGSLLSAMEPISATVFTVVWLSTAFTGWDIAGLVLMCAMVAFVSDDAQDSQDMKDVQRPNAQGNAATYEN